MLIMVNLERWFQWEQESTCVGRGDLKCPQCGQHRPDDDRVAAGMKCGQCAYGGA